MSAATAERQPNPIAIIRHELGGMTEQFKAALPAHIPVERFARVVMTAVQNNPELMECDRRSLWNAAMRAAQDGLLPDGREGAMVVRRDRDRGKIAVWQPMIAGIRKKVRNSGEIDTWDVHEVYEHDHFRFRLGDDPIIEHEYDLKQDRGDLVGAYSIAKLKTGEKSYEVMSRKAIEKIRDKTDAWKAFKAGKIKSTPWADWAEEMYRKTCARRHSKSLPMSSDLDDLIRRDDELYDFQETREDSHTDRPRSLAGRLDALAARAEALSGEARGAEDNGAGEVVTVDEDGVVQDEATPAPEHPLDTAVQEATQEEGRPMTETDKLWTARERGKAAKRAGAKRSATPGEYRTADRAEEAKAWREGWEAEPAPAEGALPLDSKGG